MSRLLPPGYDNLMDAPWPIHEAIVRALVYLGWEELPKDERPPRNIYKDSDALGEWFKEVERRREEKYGKDNSSSEIEDPVENQAARSMLVG